MSRISGQAHGVRIPHMTGSDKHTHTPYINIGACVCLSLSPQAHKRTSARRVFVRLLQKGITPEGNVTP